MGFEVALSTLKLEFAVTIVYIITYTINVNE